MSLVNHATKSVNVWWPREPKPGNVGDILTPWLIKKITGYSSTFVNKPFTKKTLLGVGSIISFTNQNTVVWGSGAMRRPTDVNIEADYRSVRGPITRDILKEKGAKCPDIFGDPALLMPFYYRPEVIRKSYSIGLFAHYVDTDLVKKWYKNSEVLIINPLNAKPEEVVKQIVKCKKIISSSLHGIIIAQAYGVPACWVKHSNKLNGDDTKFYDYFQSVNIDLKPIDFYEKIPVKDMEKFKYTADIKFDPLKIINAFPIDQRI